MKRTFTLAATVAALLFSAATLSQAADVKKAGGMLVTSSGMTVYTFDKDKTDGSPDGRGQRCTAMGSGVKRMKGRSEDMGATSVSDGRRTGTKTDRRPSPPLVLEKY